MAHRASVVLLPYSNAWPLRFETERILLAKIFAGSFCVVEHVGSTAVVGLAAKPIIDIMLGVSSFAEVNTRAAAMEDGGYEYLPQHEALMPERRFFANPFTRPRHFHVHVVIQEGAFWNRHLDFRDALRADHQLAQNYAALKFRSRPSLGTIVTVTQTQRALSSPLLCKVQCKLVARLTRRSIGPLRGR